MKKSNIIKKNYDINRIINERNNKKNKFFSIYTSKNDIGMYRFAICVSKKLGNAVIRNKIKRQIKDIIDKSNLVFSSNLDCVIIVRNEVNNLNYEQMKNNLISILEEI